MERLQWKISGEFICNVARQWFWDQLLMTKVTSL